MQFGFMPRQKNNGCNIHCKENAGGISKEGKKFAMCFVDMEKAFDRVPKKVMMWAKRKKDLSEVMIQAVIRLYWGTRQVRAGAACLKKFKVKVGVHHGSVLLPQSLYYSLQ